MTRDFPVAEAETMGQAGFMELPRGDAHSKTIGYLLWIFGFTGGLLGIGWLYDFCTLNGQVDERDRVGIP